MTPFSTFYLFVTGLSVGIAAVLPVVPTHEFGRRFFVLMSLLAVVFVGLATLDRGLEVGYCHFACAACLVIYNVLLPKQAGVDTSPRGDDGSPVVPRIYSFVALLSLFAAIICGAVGAGLDARAIARMAPPLESTRVAEVGVGILVANALTSAFLLGAAVVAMVLGHWYLVSHKLSFRPLRNLTIVLGVALLLRSVTGGVGVVAQIDFWRDSLAAAGTMKFFLSDGVFVFSRAVFGLLAPCVLVSLVWRCVRIESNQSATGILYVIVAFVFFGEILAKHFLVNLHLVI